MKWSRYSILFESQRNGWLLFNSVSRSFLSVDREQLPAIRGIMEDPEGYDYSACPLLYMELRAAGFLVEDSGDDDTYNIIKMQALTNLYAGVPLMLTVAITRACNFDCSYCFEGNRTGKPMSKEVEDKLIAFIQRSGIRNLNITWYGGEPLLAFDRILSINQRLGELGLTYNANMITNGYLLTKEKVKELNRLHVTYLQITLDGSRKTHDGRRYLKNGAPTYDTILQSIDRVMASDYRGGVHIRVNVDGRNDDEFPVVYEMIRSRYPKDFGRRITVYPGFVKGDDHPDVSCFFEAEQQGQFISRMVREYGITPLPLFPQRVSYGCTLTKRNAFVVGPDGELYKCWDDVGIREKIVGFLDQPGNWNLPLLAEGMTGCSYLDSAECKECFYFPICNGGCHRIRQKNLHAEVQHSPCTYFRGNLENLLELYYEQKLQQGQKLQRGQKAQQKQEPRQAAKA